ncbi:phage tail spike protein [Enterococcus diestrammenae]|uniref:phage tail spike protein n=1 Tax=Enterococcus diestrammenae TaxID=1155073 RepID=UPI00195C15AD
MKIYVVTKNDETVAVMDNEVSGALHFSDDEFHRYLDNGASTFDLTVAKKHRIYSNATDIEMEDFQYLVANNFLIFTYKNKDYKFTIRRVEETETSIRLFCEDLSFDLLNEYRGPYIADKAYSIAKYVNDCLYDSGYTIGINEFAKNTRTLKWEGDDTVLKRLLSICNSFDAELEFETQLNDDRTVNKQLVHLRKRVGLNRPDIELKYGREVSSIRRNVDLTELITAIKPRGHENDGKYVTIKNVAKEVKDADGNVAYFTKKGSEYLYAPMANQIYGSPEKKSGGYIVGQFSYDTESDTELYNRALTELQLKCMPAYEYEIEGFYDVDIGDTVRAIDEAYNPILMLEARISEQVISFTDPTRNKTVYSNYRVLNNLVSQSLLDRIDDVKDYAEQVARTYIFSLKNVGSSMFKNGIGEVTYTAKAEKNNNDVTSEFDSFNWTKQLKDGTPDEAWNALHVDFGTVLTVTPDDFEDTATFSYVALKGEETFGGASGVVVKVYDGEDGKTPVKGSDYFDGADGQDGRSAYLHIKYSINSNGTPMTDNPVGAMYVGMQVSQNPTPSTSPADYDWTLVKGADGIPGEKGSDGRTSYLHIKYSNDGGKTLTANSGETAGAWLGQYVDFESADSTDVSKYAWSKIKGDTGERGVAGAQGPKGDQGIAGPKGADGQTQYTHIAYANSADGTVDFSVSNADRKYIGMYVDFTATDSTTPSDYAWTLVKGADGAQGTAGKAGADGKTPYFHTAWANSADGKTGFSTTVSAGKTYLGTYTDYTQADSTDPTKYAWSLIKGDKGDTGDDGQTPVVHQAWSWSPDGTDRFTEVYPNENIISDATGDTGSWSVGTVHVVTDETYKGFTVVQATSSGVDWQTVRRASTEARTKFNGKKGDKVSFSIALKGIAPNASGDTGIAHVLVEEYKTEASNRYKWGGDIHPDLTLGAWGEYSNTYTIQGDSTAYIALIILFRTNNVANTTAFRVAVPKLEWSSVSTPYTTPKNVDYANAYPLYEGTYTDYSETASQNPADYTWRRIIGESGQDGVAGADGKGIKSTAVSYQASTSGTVAPTGTWVANPPAVTKGQYLWTRTIWTYTDNATETGYSVAYVAKDGNDGNDGIAGKDGVGIKSTAITYAVTSSGTTAPSSGWVASPPTATAGQFMWTRTVWTYTDNTTETGYSVGKIGNNGTNGKDGEDGSNGVSVSSVTEEYYVSTSSTSQTGGNWSTTVPNNANPNLYVWRRVKNTMSDGTVSYTTPALIQGMTGIYPYIGPTQPANPKEGQQWWKSDSNGNVTDFYVYHDGSWQGQTIQQSILNIVELNAVTISGSTITGTTINGSRFVNESDYGDTGTEIHAITTVAGNISMEWKSNIGTSNGLLTIYPDYLQSDMYSDAAKTQRVGTWSLGNGGLTVGQGNAGVSTFKGASIGPNGIGITDPRYAPTYGEVSLTYQDLMTLPTVGIPAASGWSQYATSGSNWPTATRNGRLVQLTGSFKNSSVIPAGDASVMGTIPVGYRPAQRCNFLMQGSGRNIYLMYVNTDGRIEFSRYRSGSSYADCDAGSWLNVSCSFVAGDI